MLSFIPRDFEVCKGDEEISTVVFSDLRLVPKEIPNGVAYICKLNGSIRHFIDLLLLYDDNFQSVKAQFVLLCLGTWDLTKEKKELTHHYKTKFLDYFFVPKYKSKLVSQQLNCLCEQIRDANPTAKIISTDPLSLTTSGYHNTGVVFIHKKVESVSENHVHLKTYPRYQRDFKRKKVKVDLVPCAEKRFASEVELIEEEKLLLIQAALQASSVAVKENVVVGDAFFTRVL